MFLGPSGQGSGCLIMVAEVCGVNDKYWPRLWNLDRFRRLFLTRLGRRGFLQVVESCLAELEEDFVLPPLVIRILLVKCLWHVLDVNELLKWKKKELIQGDLKLLLRSIRSNDYQKQIKFWAQKVPQKAELSPLTLTPLVRNCEDVETFPTIIYILISKNYWIIDEACQLKVFFFFFERGRYDEPHFFFFCGR